MGCYLATQWHLGDWVATSINDMAFTSCCAEQQAAAVRRPNHQHQFKFQLLAPDAVACSLACQFLLLSHCGKVVTCRFNSLSSLFQLSSAHMLSAHWLCIAEDLITGI